MTNTQEQDNQASSLLTAIKPLFKSAPLQLSPPLIPNSPLTTTTTTATATTMAPAAPPPDKLVPNDPRVTHHNVTLNGHKWHYLLGTPPSPVGTILLVHGHPDLAFGWRYQVPHLLSLNLRVIVPDMLGYGDTDAPEDPAEARIPPPLTSPAPKQN